MDKTQTIARLQLPNKKERHQLFGSVAPGPKSKPTEKSKMPDLQNIKKDFLFDLDVCGVSNIKYPISVKSILKPEVQTTIGTFRFSSTIEKTSKGTNMSRFMEQLNKYHEVGFTADFATMRLFTKELAERLEKPDAEIEVSFPWFYERRGPQSDLAGMNHANVTLRAVYDERKGYKFSGSLSVLITTLCPCSKEISEYSAHNQRGNVTINIDFDENFDDEFFDWKEALLEAAESNASARLHPVLKRPDEKVVTETAYENPRFVEDMVRLVAADLYEMDFVRKFEVICRNEESIHMHDAIASLTYDKALEEAGE
ncbi:GTP cyclohydrolase FolE2 [Aciduricibacillus chroicocephali]|uniref:GTP cyclohydrolase FolE2 n=1 Tax=Aciduricibacillus chroicocephali TaxID=3054939 RepID=A0ABY9KYS9_9BACI|nr:GTP cyclohydrolase FolE2 [Bacillaceae bacterium 44XB]